ncbi:hypothetical protein Dimus_028062 [Dionaea muscipula]
MVRGFLFCGISSFSRDDDDQEYYDYKIIPSSKFPSPIRRKPSGRNRMEEKNPFAARGLKQFCALLAEVEERRQKIYSEFGAEAISLIQFVYSDDNKCRPIVVRINKGNTGEDPIELGRPAPAVVSAPPDHEDQLGKKFRFRHKMNLLRWSKKMERPRVQRFYLWPVMVIILSLLMLALFGRSSAISLTSIAWYLVPPSMTNGNHGGSDSDLRKHKTMKKDDGRRKLALAEKKKTLHRGFCSFKTKGDSISKAGYSHSHSHSHSHELG